MKMIRLLVHSVKGPFTFSHVTEPTHVQIARRAWSLSQFLYGDFFRVLNLKTFDISTTRLKYAKINTF